MTQEQESPVKMLQKNPYEYDKSPDNIEDEKRSPHLDFSKIKEEEKEPSDRSFEVGDIDDEDAGVESEENIVTK